ncbi:MAG TPA: AI-2E family transporter [Stellaceae bacterium]
MARDERAPVSGSALAVAIALALVVVYAVRLAVLPFLIAAAIAYAAEPANLWLQHRFRLSRRIAAVVTFAVLMAIIGGFGFWVIESLAADLGTVLRDLPELLHKFFADLFGGEAVRLFGRSLDASAMAQQITDALFDAIATPQQMIEAALLGFAAITAAVLVIVLVFYFLDAGPQLAQGMLWLVPPEYRDEAAALAAKIGPILRRYLLGLLVIVVFATVISWIAIRFALGLPFAWLLALLTGLFELIPVIGPLASAVMVGLLALGRHGAWAVIAFAAYVTVFRLLIDRVVGPLVLGRAARLHPVVVIFAFLAGGLLLGLTGVILAVPVAAALKVVLEHYYGRPARRV